MSTTSVLQAFVTLVVIIDPIAVVPMFAALTSRMAPARRRLAAFRAIGVAFLVLFLFGIGGEAFLRLSGISLDAFRISGGLLLFLIAAEMLFEKRTQRRNHQTEENDDEHDPSIFPIGVPLVAGPGAMATMVLLVSQNDSWAWFGLVNVIMAVVLAITLALFLAAGLMTRLMGKTGINVLTRLFGILLAALAVQIVLDGLGGYGLNPIERVIAQPLSQ